MKFARYKNKLFIIAHSKQNKYYLLSYKQFDKNFNKTQFPDFYVSHAFNINDPALTDIFDVQYLINYDAGIPGLSKIWKNPLFDDHKDQVYLSVYNNHPLPGWHKRRNSALCTKDVNFEQIGKAKLIYTYYKKNGYALVQPRIDYVDVDLRTLRKIINYYHSVIK